MVILWTAFFALVTGASAACAGQEKLEVLQLMRRNVRMSAEEITETLRHSCPTLTLDMTRAVRDEIFAQCAVPTWFHDALENFARAGGTDPNYPVLVAHLNKLANQHEKTPQLALNREVWMRYAINPLISMKRSFFIRAKTQGFVSLIPNQVVQYIEEVIMEELTSKSSNSIAHTTSAPSSSVPLIELRKSVMKELRADPMSSAAGIAAKLNADAPTIQRIKTSILAPYTQHAWFLDVLLTFHGELSPTNIELENVIREEMVRRNSAISGDISTAIQIWKDLCIVPIRRGDVNPLPYARSYPVVDGKELELVHLRTKIVQSHLNNISP